ncbi:MAG: FtsX-like permease family protein [Bacteroidetes bacterium]|nr:FtsX-like permease family protein [Bacteroidota bacterium]
MRIRYLKVLRDLTSDYGKNFMLVLAIAIGVFGIGVILGGYSVITREMKKNYMGTIPASATLEMRDSIPKELMESVRSFPGIKDAERHATIVARMKVGEKWYPLLLFVVDDFNDMRTNKFNRISGALEPPSKTMLVERTALVMMQAKEGDNIVIKTPNGNPAEVKISGIVHDPGLAPAWQEQAGYAYIALSTLEQLGENPEFDQLRILVDANNMSAPHIRQKASELADALNKHGHFVEEIQVPPPGKHPHQGQMNAVLTIFIVFSFLTLILGSILVATSMQTLMVKHVRQIGIMKTIGATSGQITGIYFFMMILICLVAMLFVPPSHAAASLLYNQVAALLNLEITDRSIPVIVPIIQVIAGISIPLIAAAFPVIRGSKISVRAALDNYGLSKKEEKKSTGSSAMVTKFFGETINLSFRNVFRHRSRLVMTISLLAAGGAMFMTALNVSEAWNTNLKRIYKQRLYDVELKFNKAIYTDSLLAKIKSVQGVKGVEAWSYSPTALVKENSFEVTSAYPDKGHGSFTIQAMPVPTTMLNPTITSGRWLNNANGNDALLNQNAKAIVPNIKIGDNISLAVNRKPTTWRVIGFTEDVGSPATVYVSIDAFARLTNSSGKVKMLRVAYDDRSIPNVSQKNLEIEKLLEKENVPLSQSIPAWLLQNAIASHMKVLINSLLAMAVLMALVGTLGLMSTMSMNVMERTREIGVMRAIGATPKKIRTLIAWEGLIIGTLSLFAAFALSLLFSSLMGNFIGNMSFRTPLSLTISLTAMAIWVVIIGGGSYAATLYPARRAGKLSTREALAYE